MGNLVFFFDQPPKVGKGCFNAVSKMWHGDVFYVYLNGFNETRKTINWDDGDYGKAILIDLGKCDSIEKEISDIFEKNSDAVFVLCGLKSSIKRYLDGYIKSRTYKFMCFAERPGVYGVWWKKLLKRIYVPISEIIIALKYQRYVDAFLPLGETGVNTYAKYGWKRSKLFTFMYDPVNYVTDHEISYPRERMKLLYVGRFSRYTKGTDTLKKAFDLLCDLDDKYTLTLVGGYGDMRDEMLAWVDSRPNTEYLGRWDSNIVGPKMKDYDVCIVPSKFDGWNLLVNESVRAHIATIVSNEAVSDEVIKCSKSGLVVPARSSRELANAIRTAVCNPQMVFEWKRNAKNFSTRIDSTVVAGYFIDIIEYTYTDNKNLKRPCCPWTM